MTKVDLCEDCAKAEPPFSGFTGGWTSYSPLEAFEVAFRNGRRFPFEAYELVRDAILFAKGELIQSVGEGQPTHVSGAEVLEAFRKLSIERFGKIAYHQLRLWGIRRTEDVGEIVFELASAGFIGTQAEDCPADFVNRYDFITAFPVS